jgi:hypothetical protein
VECTEVEDGAKGKNQADCATIQQLDINEQTKVFLVRRMPCPLILFMKSRVKWTKLSSCNTMQCINLKGESGYSIRREKRVPCREGIDTKRYASAQTMLSCERKIIWSMNAFVAMYASLFEKALGIKVRLADQLQEVKDLLKDGGYATHNDQAGLCCLIGDEEPMSPENEFDGPEFMVVATYVLSNEQCQNTVVTWKKNEDQKVTRSLRTASNEIHFQAINCQALAKHEVKAIAGKANRFGPNGYRLVFSGRATMHFQQRNEKMQMQRIRVHCFGSKSTAEKKELQPLRNEYKYMNVLHGGTDTGHEIEVQLTNQPVSDEENSDNAMSNDAVETERTSHSEARLRLKRKRQQAQGSNCHEEHDAAATTKTIGDETAPNAAKDTGVAFVSKMRLPEDTHTGMQVIMTTIQCNQKTQSYCRTCSIKYQQVESSTMRNYKRVSNKVQS